MRTSFNKEIKTALFGERGLTAYFSNFGFDQVSLSILETTIRKNTPPDIEERLREMLRLRLTNPSAQSGQLELSFQLTPYYLIRVLGVLGKVSEWPEELVTAFKEKGLNPENYQAGKDSGKLWDQYVVPLEVLQAARSQIPTPQSPIQPSGRDIRYEKRFAPSPPDNPTEYKDIGLVHRYPGTLLVLPTTSCLGHCMGCFRTDFVSNKEERVNKDTTVDKAIRYFVTHNRTAEKGINDFLLSGGDPFMLPLDIVNDIFSKILHDQEVAGLGAADLTEFRRELKYLRVDTKALVFDSDLYLNNPAFKTMLEFIRDNARANHINVEFVLSIHHPAEITEELRQLVYLIKDHGITVGQQAPINSVNCDANILRDLMGKLSELGIKSNKFLMMRGGMEESAGLGIDFGTALTEARKAAELGFVGTNNQIRITCSHATGKWLVSEITNGDEHLIHLQRVRSPRAEVVLHEQYRQIPDSFCVDWESGSKATWIDDIFEQIGVPKIKVEPANSIDRA